jgi:hypothetical protein
MSRRTIGIAAIVIGFVVTAIAGFILAASNLQSGALLTRALIAFAIVLPIMLFGIYFYVTSDRDLVSSTLSDTELQLKLIDIIRERKRVSLEDLAAELQVDMTAITRLVEDLDALDLFTGYIDWNNRVVYAVRPNELRDTNP